jgi:hypothetical protein
MSLMRFPFGFTNSIDNLESGSPSSTNQIGSQVTAGTNNNNGTVVKLFDALPFDVHYMVITAGGYNASTIDSNAALRVVTDPTGGTTWSDLINSLMVGYTATLTATACFANQYAFPIYIKAGSSVGVSASKNGGTGLGTTGRVIMWLYGDPSRPEMWWCGQQVERLGITDNSRGINITSGSSNAWGAWTNIGTSTQRYGALQFGINGSDSASTANGYLFQVGTDGNKLAGSHTIHRTLSTTETGMITTPAMPIFCDTPAGTTFQMRGKASGTQEALNGSIYGVY